MKISSSYFGSIDYFSLISRRCDIEFDGAEVYRKQTFLNRCRILGPNGIQSLTVPVEHHGRCLMRDVVISTHHDWQHQHWMALLSSYGSSPYFEFYVDDLRPLFTRCWRYLFDLNIATTEIIVDLLSLRRQTFSHERVVVYSQLYDRRFGFQPNLSILDLLFNMGNESVFYL